MSDAFNSNKIELELQVRLMNLVLGEASDFERDQLQEMMEQRSELADYYQQLQHLHGLLCEVGAGDPSLEFDASTAEDAWQLPADRRERVLAVLDMQSPNPPGRVTLATTGEPTRWRMKLLGAVAVASIACFLMGLWSQTGMLTSLRETSVKGGVARSIRPPAYYLDDDVQYIAPGLPEGKARVLNGPSFQNASGSEVQSNLERPIDQLQSLAVVELDKSRGRQAGGVAGSGSGFPGGYGGFSASGRGGGMGGSGMGGSGVIPLSATSTEPAIGKPSGDFFNNPQLDFRSERNNPGPQDQPGLAAVVPAVPTNPETQWYGNGIAENRGWRLELPKLEADDWENASSYRGRVSGGLDSDVAASKDSAPATEPSLSFAVPNDGRVLLGGIASTRADSQINRLYSNPNSNPNDQSDASDTLMLSVTPRIIIPEEEEEILIESRNAFRNTLSAEGGRPSIKNADGDRKKGDTAGKSEKMYEIKSSNEFESRNLASLSLSRPSEENKIGSEDGKPGTSNASTRDWVESKEGLSDFARSQKAYSELVEKQKAWSAQVIAKGNEDTASQREGENPSTSSDIRYRLAPQPGSVAVGRGVQDKNLAGKPGAPPQPPSLDEQSATTDPFSTFSLHVSDVSFKLAQAVLSQGQWPEATQIRIEDFVNALDYRDPLPNGKEKVACRIEQAIHPFLMQRNLLRVSMRTAATGRSQSTPLRLTLLLDNSGSMERPDRRQAVLRAFQTLTQQLSAADQITLISFANKPRLLADKVPGNQGESLLQLIENLPSEGGTNIEAALVLAHEKAAEQQLAGAQNRIVLLTDGAVNLGDANPESLARLITQMRDSGIAFDAAGISAQDLNDQVLEALTRQGDGRYYLLDSAADAGERFAAQIAGALRPSAQNVKVQIEFNPERVGRYKLLGFEKHRLQKEDFRNDRVDAAEMAAAEAGVAVYQFEIKPNGRGDVGSVSVRFRDVSTGQMVERRWPIPYESNAPRLEQADPSLQLAASAALFAAKLSGGPLADIVDLAQLQNVLAKLPERVASQPRVQQLRAMIDQAKAIGR
jgi:Mg-chelatase subunit ChlD